MKIWEDKKYIKHGDDKLLHRTIAEKALGRKLKGTEQVHHIDYNGKNNSPSNLVICPDMKYHKLLHARQKIIDYGGCPDTHAFCSYHKCLHLKEEFSTKSSRWNGLHNTCRNGTNEYRKHNGLNCGKFDWKARLSQQYRRIKTGYKKSVKLCWVSPKEENQ